MEHLCRLCGSEGRIKVEIFEAGTDRVKRIHKILPISINEHDPFPNHICHVCSFKVDEFFAFRTCTIKTQEILKNKVPWLRDKQLPLRIEGEQPMVEVTLNSVNAVSPNEKHLSRSNESGLNLSQDLAILIEDSPPYAEHSDGFNGLVEDYEVDEQKIETMTGKRKKSKSRSRSLWDTKKRKKKQRKSCRIVEVFTTSEQEYQNLNDIENDPLRLTPVNHNENNSFDNIVENNTCVVNSPKSELGFIEKGILTDDRGGANIALPKYILTTKIPRVGNVYTCERCGRTYLNLQLARQHICPENLVEEDRPKEELQLHEESEISTEKDVTKDFYQCRDCGHVFTRHSQLVSHQKKHTNRVDYSSDDSLEPISKRRKHHTKKKHRPRLMNTNNNYSTIKEKHNQNCSSTNNFNANTTTTDHYDSNTTVTNNYITSTITTNNFHTNTYERTGPSLLFNFDAVETNITRHSLLSSDSE